MAESEPLAQASRRVLIVMAHPDDGEFGCGATVAKWAAEGRDVFYCLVTDGQVGDAGDETITSEELAGVRQVEAQAAARALGVRNDVIFLHYMDSRLEPTLELRRDIARVIRRVKPDVVICQDPTVRWSGQGYINHPDHRAAGEATLAAIMPVASTRLAFPELAAEGLKAHNVREIYISSSQNADRWVDVEGFIEQKIAGLRAHKSQLRDWDPGSSVEQWAKDTAAVARKHGHDMKLAEAFKYIRLEDD
ncbi:MAG TPA: PIG-L deacetylase family protein [Ktedonobacterales bacterium]|jgi:LmbE family N-acetylglucosaminyl deacetylase|nr:PIG-L deacetylase family protein [Ktedonobacterales bacterium]